MTLKIGNYLVAHNTANNQSYQTQIVRITPTYYFCRKLKTIFNSELYYYTSSAYPDIASINSFIDAHQSNIYFDFKKRSQYPATDTFDIELIKCLFIHKVNNKCCINYLIIFYCRNIHNSISFFQICPYQRLVTTE